MKRWWTADLHITHANVIRYCDRPFRDLQHMQDSLVRNFNGRVKPGDTVVHLGDLGTKGRERGVDGSRVRPTEYLKLFTGTWVLLEGNHDPGNRVKTVGVRLSGSIGPYKFVAQHVPMNHVGVPQPIRDLYRSCDVCLCGHVHQHWRTQWIDGLLHINVGVDSNRYRPLDDNEVIGIISQEKRKRDKEN